MCMHGEDYIICRGLKWKDGGRKEGETGIGMKKVRERGVWVKDSHQKLKDERKNGWRNARIK